MTQYFYRAYGLIFQSDHPIDALTQCDEQAADVTIIRQNFDAQIKGQVFAASYANWRAAENVLMLQIRNVGQYLIRGGTEIWIDPDANATLDDLNAFLISSAFAALLQQREFLTLHASAIAGPQGAVLFIGRSGVGKSTTLAALADRGFGMVTDDIGAISFDTEHSAQITPSFPSARLRRDAVLALGKTLGDYKQVRNDVDKYLVPVANFGTGRMPVDQIFILDTHDHARIDIESLNQSDAFTWIARCTFRKRFYDGMQMSGFHFAAVSRFTASTQVRRVCRPGHPNQLEELIDKLAQEISRPAGHAQSRVGR